MQKYIFELKRLYLPAGNFSLRDLEQHLLSQSTLSISLASADGLMRGMVIPFRKAADGDEAQHWSALCALANALQGELGLPAPAVSVSGVDGFGLWLSLAVPTPAATVQRFLELLREAYFPQLGPDTAAASAAVELPPCLHAVTGKWAAFINPGLGASFAEEAGLEMAPPFAGQSALLEGLKSISEAQFIHAMAVLQQSSVAPMAADPLPAPVTNAHGLLLKDATLEDIVRHLHANNIEPTFRHLIRV